MTQTCPQAIRAASILKLVERSGFKKTFGLIQEKKTVIQLNDF